MDVKYKDIENYLDENEPVLKSLITIVNDVIEKGKKQDGIPVYLVKYRLKSNDSIYIKTKRKAIQKLEKIKDYVGYRILCLFEQNIYDIHKYLVNKLCRSSLVLDEFKIYNWDDKYFKESLEEIITKCYPDFNFEPLPSKTSGYKSIHYIFKQHNQGKDYFIEIQLRTLLQDVWSELEHTLSYKQGQIHPHITKSFLLLQRDLETNDQLITHLKSISDKEQEGQIYSIQRGGPVYFYDYEAELIPEEFKQGELKNVFESYIKFMKSINFRKDNKKSLIEARNLYATLDKSAAPFIRNNKEVKYIIEMEEAFIKFWEGGKKNIDEVLKIYKKLKDDFPDHYILSFRIGEIFFVIGNIIDALKSFDECEYMLLSSSSLDHFNRYSVKIKLAYIYWILGKEFIHIALKKINEAEKIYYEHKVSIMDQVPGHDFEGNLLNNLCSYYLSNYLDTKKDIDYQSALDKLTRLQKYIESNKDKENANILDTISWFHYHIYLKEKKLDNLLYAEEKCQLIGNRENYSTFWITSWNIHQNHIQEIMSAFRKLCQQNKMGVALS